MVYRGDEDAFEISKRGRSKAKLADEEEWNESESDSDDNGPDRRLTRLQPGEIEDEQIESEDESSDDEDQD